MSIKRRFLQLQRRLLGIEKEGSKKLVLKPLTFIMDSMEGYDYINNTEELTSEITGTTPQTNDCINK